MTHDPEAEGTDVAAGRDSGHQQASDAPAGLPDLTRPAPATTDAARARAAADDPEAERERRREADLIGE